MSSLAARWLRGIPSLKELQLRAAVLAADLSREPLGEVADALEVVALSTEQADERAREVMAALMPTLTDPKNGALLEGLRELAQERSLFALARLLRKRGGLRDGAHDVPEPEERHPGNMPQGRSLTLGERKALARGRDRFMLDRLLRDPHPQVIRNVLTNPRITEDDVVRLAARRPTFPDVQAEIAKSARWGVRQRVRVALIQNPYTPPGIAVPLLPLLVRGELLSVMDAMDVPPIVRAGALELLDRRPPIREPPEPEIKQ